MNTFRSHRLHCFCQGFHNLFRLVQLHYIRINIILVTINIYSDGVLLVVRL